MRLPHVALLRPAQPVAGFDTGGGLRCEQRCIGLGGAGFGAAGGAIRNDRDCCRSRSRGAGRRPALVHRLRRAPCDASPACTNTRRGSMCSALSSQLRIGCGTEMLISTSPRPPRCSVSRSGRPANIATAISAACTTSTRRSRRAPPADEGTATRSSFQYRSVENRSCSIAGAEHVVGDAHFSVGEHDALRRDRAVREIAALPMELGKRVEHFLEHEHGRAGGDRLAARLRAREHVREPRAAGQIVDEADRREPAGLRG